ncbi:pectate lyase [Ferruginibacter lapsinanis]|uniref:pectate lyase n=1 Tax=Ferruginibacter lapsinanis TaxID=563172 RepID=UPI001E3E790B|nr:pectate lyase [Ferruginibacter lapsinanis]UEG49033.1 pectate lyase [Ferruginibacter lapsinanis]
MKKTFWLLLLSVYALHSFAQTEDRIITEIDTMPFQNSAHHWYDIFEPQNIFNPILNQPRFDPSEITAIADNIILYQKDNGGWPKNYDMRAILTSEQKKLIRSKKNITNTTFDNSTTYSHVDCLANVYRATKNKKYKAACLKGLDFILSAQYTNGGWPQYFPLEDNYSNCITYNDDVMTGILSVFNNIINNAPAYSFLDARRRKKIKIAFDKGMHCVLATQINDNNKLTGWCQQYDPVTLAPAWARKFEPPSICNRESATLVLFLMTINNPSKELIDAIQGAVRWFNDSKILYTRVKTITAPTIVYKVRKSSTDKIVVTDSAAPPIWARYYELKTERPLFCNRDGKVVYTLAEVERERRDGYGWYVYDPKLVLNKYPEWQKKYAPDNDVLAPRSKEM